MSDDLTAGERMVPPEPPQDSPKPSRGGKRARAQADAKGAEKKAARKKRVGVFGWIGRLFGLLLGLGLVGAVAGGVIGYSAYERYSAELPTVDGLRHYQPKVMSRIYAGDQKLIAELATERRIFVPFNALPDLVKQAFISAEDQNFWTHRGVDPIAILRAAVTDFQQMGQGRRPIGASTITQQVAKNMLLANSEVSLARKAREALLAIRIEKALEKERILELYLNEIYLGLQSYGVAAAAQAYFNKSLESLTISEAAFLAALPKAPNNYNPFRFPEAARARRDWVIDRMADDRAISQDLARAAKAEPIRPAAYRRPEIAAGSDWFAEEVRRNLVDKFGADTSTQGGLVVRTSFDPALQAAADKYLREGLQAYDRLRGGWRGPVAKVDASAALKTRWNSDLAQMTRPPGMLQDWRLAMVLEVTDQEAKVGVVLPSSPGAAPAPAGAAPPANSRILPMPFAETNWARQPGPPGGRPGPAPRKMSDVVKPGDVVMVELMPEVKPQGKVPARPERLALRQIPQVQGALVSLEVATGRVLAMSGGWSFETSQFNRVTQASRQPGSSFKPMVYLTAMQAGISPSQKFLDAPYVKNLGAAGSWRPGNYEGNFSGPMPLRVALEKSLNLVTVRVAEQVGMEAVAQTAIRFHVVDNMPRVLPASLGAVETTVLRQAAAYASLAAGGREVTPTLIDSVQDREGRVIWRPDVALACANCDDPTRPPEILDDRAQLSDPQSVFQLTMMLNGAATRGTGARASQGLGRPIAGKTGTTQDFNDAWFVGFTPDIATAVWVGYDNPQSLGEGETGGSIAAPIWHDYMAVALRDRPKLDFVPPEGVLVAKWESGYGQVTDAFKPGQVPGESGSVASGDAASTAASASTAGARGGTPTASGGGGIDSGMGGLY